MAGWDAIEQLPEVPLSKAIAQAAANGRTVKAVDASSAVFIVLGEESGVSINSRLPNKVLAAVLRGIADDIDARPDEPDE